MNIKYRLLCKRLIEERKRVGVIQYYNVLFIMELVSDKDIWSLEQWVNGINNIYMKDIHLKQLTKFYEVIARKLNIRNGVIKGDLVIHDGQLYIIEFALRLSGGNFSTICIPNSSHHDIIKYATMIHLNLPIDKIELNNEKKNDFISMRYKFLEESNIKPNEKVKDIISKVKKDEIIYTNMHYGKGSIIPDRTTDHSKRLGFVITKGNSRKDAIFKANNYLKKLEFIVE